MDIELEWNKEPGWYMTLDYDTQNELIARRIARTTQNKNTEQQKPQATTPPINKNINKQRRKA